MQDYKYSQKYQTKNLKFTTFKSSSLYKVIIIFWLVLSAISLPFFLILILEAYFYEGGLLERILVFISSLTATLFIFYFWLNGIKDIFYTLAFWFNRSHYLELKKPETNLSPRIDMIYVTCNDFDGESLKACINQDYDRSKINWYILDDSKDEKIKKEIDDFALQNNMIVVRRKDNRGFKAGNINNWLINNTKPAPFFVILDSDEIIPPDFIKKALPYFEFEDVSIVQANHISTRNHTVFSSIFAKGVESHWQAYQTVKNKFGYMSLLGHGAMLKLEDVLNAGGVPEVVAEDLALSLKLKENGKYAVFAPEIVCEETYPVDYFSFRKRHAKWTMGNMEFIQKFSYLFGSKKYKWFEKMDILLFVYNLPLTTIFVSFMIIHLVIFPLLRFDPNYNSWLMTPTLLTLLAPLLNDLIYFSPKIKTHKLIWYVIHLILLYGSMYFISFWSALRAFFGKSVFLVTPKNAASFSLNSSLSETYMEIIFGIILFLVAIYTNQLYAVILISIPSICALYLGLLGYGEKDPHISKTSDMVFLKKRKISHKFSASLLIFVILLSGFFLAGGFPNQKQDSTFEVLKICFEDLKNQNLQKCEIAIKSN